MLSMARQTKSQFLTWRLKINYTCTQSSISAKEHLYGKRKITHLYHCKKCQLNLYFKHVDQQVFIDSARKKKKKKNTQQFTEMDLRLLFKCGAYFMQAWFNINC